MKHLFYTLFLLIATVMNAACSDDDGGNQDGNRPLSVSQTELTFEGLGGEQTFYAQCGREYQVTSANPEWCTVIADGQRFEGLDQYVVRISFNSSDQPRNTTVTLTDGRTTEQIAITQGGMNFPVAPDATGMEHTAMEILYSIDNGWNLYNTLEATGGETAWGQPLTTQAVIDNAKAAGFNGIRIPCSWDQYMVAGSENYEIDPTWMARVKEVVDYCMNAGVYAILNIHWDGGWLENDSPNGYNEEVEAKQFSYWTQIATTFRDYDEHLIFASANEPNVETEEQWETLRQYHQACINAVRSTGGRNMYRTILIQAPSTNIDKAYTMMDKLPADPTADRMGIEVHYYAPAPFCLMEEDGQWGGMCQWFWGDDMEQYAEGDWAIRWSAEGNEAYVNDQFQLMYNKFVAEGYPVFVGEFGMMTRNIAEQFDDPNADEAQLLHDASREAFVRTVASVAKAHGCVPCYWGTVFDRETGETADEYVARGLAAGAETPYPDL